MQRLRIDFLKRRPPVSLLGWALSIAGVASMAVAALDYSQARDELQSALDHAERQARGSKQRARSNTTAPTVAPELLRASARADAALSQPWGRLLRDLETLADSRVALLGVEAQGAARTLRITGEAATVADAVDYVERLRQSPLTRSAVLGSHEWRNAEGVDVIRFSVDMAWGTPS